MDSGSRFQSAPQSFLARLAPHRLLHLPARTVRLRLTLLYGGLFVLSGTALLAISYLIFRRASRVNVIIPNGPTRGTAAQDAATELRYTELVRHSTDALHHGLLRSAIVLAIMTVASIALGWLIAGRVLHPLRAMTVTTRQISERNLNERLALSGPRDELKDLADTIDGLLARLEAHVAEQQRFAANASHELRTPLAVTQTLLDVARNDPNHANGELVDRLHEVNTRAIDLIEALLLLSRADQRPFSREHVDLSLMAEEATETLLPLAEARGVTIVTSGEETPTIGSHALLLQLTTNLYTTPSSTTCPDRAPCGSGPALTPKAWSSSSRTPASTSPRHWLPRLPSRFSAPPNAYAPATQALVSAWQSSRASPKHTTEPSPSPPARPAGSVPRSNYPSRHNPSSCSGAQARRSRRRPRNDPAVTSSDSAASARRLTKQHRRHVRQPAAGAFLSRAPARTGIEHPPQPATHVYRCRLREMCLARIRGRPCRSWPWATRMVLRVANCEHSQTVRSIVLLFIRSARLRPLAPECGPQLAQGRRRCAKA